MSALPSTHFHYSQFCPTAKAAEVLGERWTILIVRELLLGTRRYSDFQRALSQISPTLLTKRLNQLADCGLVIRQTKLGNRRPEYELSPAGKELQPIILGLGEWGMKWARGQMRDDELDVHLLMYDYCRRIDVTALPSGRLVAGFFFPGLPKFAHWWIVIEVTGERELCVDHPGKEVDIQIRSDVRTMVEIWAGDTEMNVALKTGRIALSGKPALVRTLTSWLRPGSLSHIRPDPDRLRV